MTPKKIKKIIKKHYYINEISKEYIGSNKKYTISVNCLSTLNEFSVIKSIKNLDELKDLNLSYQIGKNIEIVGIIPETQNEIYIKTVNQKFNKKQKFKNLINVTYNTLKDIIFY